jgi:endonuclease-3
VAGKGRGSGAPRQPLARQRPGAAAAKGASKFGMTTKGKVAPATGTRPTGAPTSPRTATGRPAAKGAAKGATKPAPKKPRRIARAELPAHAAELHKRLVALYPDAHCELDYRNPFELLCATILSAQCTDKRVNMTTPALFARYPDARALAAARQEEVEELVKSTGFFRSKAKNLIAMAGDLVDRHGGEVPADMDALVVLAGVGRKTANVVLGNAFHINVGVVVDTHVARLSARLGLTAETDPVKIEQALMPLFPRDAWTMLSHLLIWHGRRTCDAKKPQCGACALADICPSAQLSS